LTGYTCYDEVYVNELIVVEKYRDKGVGSGLMKYLENYYKDKNFNNINLVTNAFQAPEFYKKLGFELEFVRENKENQKLSKYFFVKFF
jgi:ribosomal protein S18 acetylase RimI-like enzyme